MAYRITAVWCLFVLTLLNVCIQETLTIDLSLGFTQLSPQEVIVQRNQPLLLNCTGYSESEYGPLRITWRYEGEELEQNKHQYVLENGSLVIDRITGQKKNHGRRDEGNYTCLLHNNVGTLVSRTIRVIVARMSRVFSVEPEPMIVEKGGNAYFYCQIQAVPSAIITWQLNNKDLPQNSSRHLLLPSGAIQIIGVTETDAGNYRCVAANVARVRYSNEALLTVSTDAKIPEVPYFLSPPFQQVTVLTKEDAVLECMVNGYFSPEIKWIRGEDERPLPEDRISRLGQGNLVIKSVTVEDTGVYICSATVKDPKTDTVQVISQKSTLIVYVSPEFIDRPLSQVKPTAQTARFECTVDGIPAPSVQWLKDGQPLYINGRIKLKTGNVLVISQTVTSDSGIYQCMATNIVSTNVASARLLVNTSSSQPDPPQGLRARTVSSSAILLMWNPAISPNGLNIQAYTVHYLPTSVPITAPSITVNSLTPTTLHVTWDQLSPENSRGVYLYCQIIIFYYYLKSVLVPMPPILHLTVINTTALEAEWSMPDENRHPVDGFLLYYRQRSHSLKGPIDVPANMTKFLITDLVPITAPSITVNSLTPTTLHVTWDQLSPENSRGVVISYRIHYRRHNQASYSVIDVAENIKDYTITGLQPKKKYDVRVMARTKIGFPVLSDEEWPWVVHEMPDAITATVPMPPILHLTVINTTALEAEWSMPDENRHPVDGFLLYYRQRSHSLKGPIDVPANMTKFLITDLAPETWYEVHLSAYNDQGEGNESVRNILTLPEDHPDVEIVEVIEPPHHLEANPTSSTSIHLIWEIPIINKNISYYTVQYHPVYSTGEINASSISYIRCTNKEVMITDLLPFTLYEFSVSSHDYKNQQGPFGMKVECKTKEDIPTAPRDLTWTPVDAHSVRLNWQIPVRPNGIIISYYILYSEHTDDEVHPDNWSTKEEQGSQLSSLVNGLASNTLYYFCMKAETRAGTGPSTPIISLNIPVRHSNYSRSSPKEIYSVEPQDPLLGIVLGISIGVGCIIICAIIIVCRNRTFWNKRTGPGRGLNPQPSLAVRCTCQLHHPDLECFPPPPPPPGNRYSVCCGNGHVPQLNGHASCNGNEKQAISSKWRELDCFTPMLSHFPNGTTERHLDTKGGYPTTICNGGSNGITHPLLAYQNGVDSNAKISEIIPESSQNESEENDMCLPVSKNRLRYTVKDCWDSEDWNDINEIQASNSHQVDDINSKLQTNHQQNKSINKDNIVLEAETSTQHENNSINHKETNSKTNSEMRSHTQSLTSLTSSHCQAEDTDEKNNSSNKPQVHAPSPAPNIYDSSSVCAMNDFSEMQSSTDPESADNCKSSASTLQPKYPHSVTPTGSILLM
ncbi:protogenin-like [Centruroides sculpturatus]|uniref:protogenin-like n=1 Tax=Centruroides sculpturatus TaxID=218467 RepID=UPI000C6D09EF|nr:protogenin-like [Centruroides sculpturatus]